MVKVAAPALSLDASGSIAGAMTFSKWKGRNYVRMLVKPANPKSAAQTGMRAGMKFLSQNWTVRSAAEKATWEDRAEAIAVSPFNAFTKYNLTRWRNFLSPTKEDPAAEAQTADLNTAEGASPGERQISVVFTAANITTQNWGVAIYRELVTGFTCSWDKCIAVLPCASGGAVVYVDSPLEPDQYFYNFKTFTEDGVWSADLTEVNATVT